jgi:hypothetical protein
MYGGVIAVSSEISKGAIRHLSVEFDNFPER